MASKPFRPSVAGASVDITVDVVFEPMPAEVPSVDHTTSTHSFLVNPYVIDTGIPQDRPMSGVLTRSLVGIGQVSYSDQRKNPLEIRTGAAQRWIPTADSFSSASGRWTPYAGDASLTWTSGAQAEPVLDLGYTYSRRRDQVTSPALVFSNGAYMALTSSGLAASSFSIGLVAVLQAGTGATYSIVESMSTDVGTGVGVDANYVVNRTAAVGLRNSHGNLSVVVGGQVANYTLQARQQAPVVILLSMQQDRGRLSVFDGGRSTRTFSLSGIAAFDLGLYLGRGSASYDSKTTGVMDVLEMDLFDHALDDSNSEGYLNLMASTYGIL